MTDRAVDAQLTLTGPGARGARVGLGAHGGSPTSWSARVDAPAPGKWTRDLRARRSVRRRGPRARGRGGAGAARPRARHAPHGALVHARRVDAFATRTSTRRGSSTCSTRRSTRAAELERAARGAPGSGAQLPLRPPRRGRGRAGRRRCAPTAPTCRTSCGPTSPTSSGCRSAGRGARAARTASRPRARTSRRTAIRSRSRRRQEPRAAALGRSRRARGTWEVERAARRGVLPHDPRRRGAVGGRAHARRRRRRATTTRSRSRSERCARAPSSPIRTATCSSSPSASRRRATRGRHPPRRRRPARRHRRAQALLARQLPLRRRSRAGQRRGSSASAASCATAISRQVAPRLANAELPDYSHGAVRGRRRGLLRQDGRRALARRRSIPTQALLETVDALEEQVKTRVNSVDNGRKFLASGQAGRGHARRRRRSSRPPATGRTSPPRRATCACSSPSTSRAPFPRASRVGRSATRCPPARRPSAVRPSSRRASRRSSTTRSSSTRAATDRPWSSRSQDVVDRADGAGDGLQPERLRRGALGRARGQRRGLDLRGARARRRRWPRCGAYRAWFHERRRPPR